MGTLMALAIVVAVLVLGLPPAGVSAQAQQPEPVITAFIDLMNARNASSALALFADDATLKTPEELHQGRSPIRDWLESHAAKNIHLAVVGTPQIAGDKVTWTAMVSRDDWQKLGLPPLETRYEALVRGGKFASLAFARSPEHEARLRAAQRAAAAAPGQLPRTGGLSVPLPIALGIGTSLLLVGFVIRRFRRWS